MIKDWKLFKENKNYELTLDICEEVVFGIETYNLDLENSEWSLLTLEPGLYYDSIYWDLKKESVDLFKRSKENSELKELIFKLYETIKNNKAYYKFQLIEDVFLDLLEDFKRKSQLTIKKKSNYNSIEIRFIFKVSKYEDSSPIFEQLVKRCSRSKYRPKEIECYFEEESKIRCLFVTYLKINN